MLTLKRTTSADPDFVELIRLLDADLAQRDGADHAFYAQYNGIDAVKHAVVAYDENERAVGSGAIKEYAPGVTEVKRMFVRPTGRQRGTATEILAELENWARELSYKKCILETGTRYPEAIALYKKCGYRITPAYGQYIGVKTSVCFAKYL